MNNKKIVQSKTELILFLLVAGQIVALTLYNLFRMPYIMDFDSAPALIQAAKFWEQKSLFLNDWWYSTNLGWDTSLPLAALFYGISNNIYIAFGMADSIILYAFLYIYYRICKGIKMSRSGKLVVVLLLLTPYSIGQLDYMNMLLASQSSYNIRALLSMTLLSIMLEFYAGKTFRNQWVICTAFLVMLFTSSCSSSLYAFISCVLPVTIFVFVDSIREDHINFKSISKPIVYFPLISVIISGIGIMFFKYMNISNAVDVKNFTTGVNFGRNFIHCFVGIFELLGGIKSDKNVAVLSSEGISLMMKLMLIFLMIFSLYFISKKSFQRKERDKFIGMSLTLIIVNLAILIFVDTTYGSVTFEYRYLIIPILPLFIFAGYLTDYIFQSHNHALKNVYIISLTTICLILNVGLYSYAFNINNGYDDLKKIKSTIDSQEIGLVNVVRGDEVQNEIDGKILKTIEDKEFIITENNHVNWWGMSDTNLENYNYTGKTAILTQKDIFESLPDYYQEHAVLIDSFSYHDYNLYVLETNRFDYISGFPKSDRTISRDFPYSFQYQIQNAEIDDYGILKSDGTAGTVLDSSVLATKGDYKLTLHYNIQDIIGASASFFLMENGKILSYVQLNPGESAAILDNIGVAESVSLNISVNVSDGTLIEIQSIEFERK